MLIDKIKYYINTTAAQRALYSAEYNELAHRASKAKCDMDYAYDALVRDVPVDKSFYSVCGCMKVMEIPPVTFSDVLTALTCPNGPVILRNECWYYNPSRSCNQRACPYHDRNQNYFVKREIYRAACAVRNRYWPNLYAKIK